MLTEGEKGECLSSGTFQKEEWEINPGVQELYTQFYRGHASEELYYMLHDVPGGEKVVPDGLVEALSRAVLKGTAYELLESLETGKVLSQADMQEAGVKSADIAGILAWVENSPGSLEMIRVDLDNDGYEDIFSEEYFGGSGGYGEYVLYQGGGDGIYRRTGVGSGEYIWRYGVISWEGKNYVWRNELDYGSKMLSGKVLEGYQDGELVETVWLNLVPEKQEVSVAFCQDGYWEIAEREKRKAQDVYEKAGRYETVLGDVEEQETESTEGRAVISSDIDNDGEPERYEKWVWTTSNMYPEWLGFQMEEEAREKAVMEAVDNSIRERDGAPMMLWVDSYNGENIVNILHRTELYDYVIDGCLVKDTEYSIVYTIEGKAELAVDAFRVKEVPGKRRLR